MVWSSLLGANTSFFLSAIGVLPPIFEAFWFSMRCKHSIKPQINGHYRGKRCAVEINTTKSANYVLSTQPSDWNWWKIAISIYKSKMKLNNALAGKQYVW